MSASFVQKLSSLLAWPVSLKGTASFLEESPRRIVAKTALAMTASVVATGAVILAFTGKQFLVIVVSAVLLAPFAGATFGGLIAIYLKLSGQVSAPAAITAPSRNTTVLLLEGDPNLREIIKEGLTTAGFHLICALNAKHAACLCRDHGGLVDLLLADTNALGGRPPDCLQTIKGPQLALPVLLISAYDRQTLCERHPDLLTAYEFVPIPFEFPHLTETIETLLQLQATPPGQPQEMGAKGSIGRTSWPN